MDFLYTEWQGKPASLITWGLAGGARGAIQLTQVLHGFRMHPLERRVEAALQPHDTNHAGHLTDAERTFGPHRQQLRLIDTEMTTLLHQRS
jgi:NAD(P)H-dependent FMN reductase